MMRVIGVVRIATVKVPGGMRMPAVTARPVHVMMRQGLAAMLGLIWRRVVV